MADSVEIAKAYVQIVPSMEGAQSAITKGLSGASEQAGSKAGGDLGGGLLGGLEGKLAKFAAPAAIASAVVAVGKMAFDMASEFDSAYDSIRTGTGATGDAFEGLKQSALAVTKSVPSSIGDVSETLAELNTRTGATGKTLEDLTKTFMELNEVGYSTDIDKATGMLTAWGVSAEDMNGKLEEMFVVSQSTGIGMDDLSSAMSTNATAMQELGFTFEDTAALAGQFDKAGLDANGMLGKLSKAMTTIAKSGEDPAEIFDAYISDMNEMIDAGDRAAAIDIATELFGTKGAAQFIQALETGTMDIDSLTAAMAESSGIIDQNAEDTRSFWENLEILKNKATAAIEPFASAVFTGLSAVLGGIIDGVDFLSEAFGNLYDTVMANETVQAILNAWSTAVEKIGSVAEKAFGIFKTSVDNLSPVLSPIASFLAGTFFSSVEKIAGIIGGTLLNAFNAIGNAADTIGDALDTLNGIISGLHFELPHFDLPHFVIEGGEVPWGVGGLGKPPKVDVQWFASGGIVDGAQLVGVGEAGAEAIIPLEGGAMRPFAQAIANDMGGAAMNVYVNNAAINTDAEIQRLFYAFMTELKRKGAM